MTGVVLRGIQKSFIGPKKCPRPGNCTSPFANDRSGISTAQVTATIPGPHRAVTAKDGGYGPGVRRPGL